MQNPMNPSSGGIALRRRAASLAVASLFAAAGAAQAFEINTGNEDLTMRWDNTLRYNLGVRAQGQNSTIMGNPNFDDGDRNFGNGSIVTNRFDVLSRIRPHLAEEVRLAGERRGMVGRRLQQPRQFEHGDGEHAGQRPAGGRRACRRTRSAMPRAPRANGWTRSRSPTSKSATCRSTSRPGSTRCTGATACCWAARCTACRTRRTRSTSGRASPRPAPKPRSCSGRAAASRSRPSPPRTFRSPASGSTTGRRSACRNRAAT